MLLAQAIGFLIFLSVRYQLFPLGNLESIEQPFKDSAIALLVAPVADRPRIAAEMSKPDFTVRALPDFQPMDLAIDIPPLFRLRDQLLKQLAGTVDQLVVEAPMKVENLGPPMPFQRPDGDLPITVWMRLQDRTWIAVTVPAGRLVPAEPLYLIIPISGAIVSILLISLLAARRISDSLRRFAGAAERFGIDLKAAPLTESGPAEVRVVIRAFNKMQARLKRFVEDRTQMLAAISHDLLTPVSRLRLRSEALPQGEERLRMLADLDLMNRMITATLDFARDDVASETRQPLDLASLLQSIADEFADAGKPVVYEGPDYLPTVAAPLALSRGIRNVVENAVRYGSRADVKLALSAGEAVITVEDDGPGIPEGELERVFEPFYRLDKARSLEPGGSGLGLAIARNVMRAHGGEIILRNRNEGGLVAQLNLPLTVARRS
jgi:signal transduction histidine kinase